MQLCLCSFLGALGKFTSSSNVVKIICITIRSLFSHWWMFLRTKHVHYTLNLLIIFIHNIFLRIHSEQEIEEKYHYCGSKYNSIHTRWTYACEVRTLKIKKICFDLLISVYVLLCTTTKTLTRNVNNRQ